MLKFNTTLTGALCLCACAIAFATPSTAGGDIIRPEPIKVEKTNSIDNTELNVVNARRRSGDIIRVVNAGNDTVADAAETEAKKAAGKPAKSAARKSSPRSGKTATTNKSGKSAYAAIIIAAARKHGVPVHLAKAVVQVESNFNPRARGSAGEVGLMQIKPATARGLGYRGSVTALYDPKTNIEWGMKYLAGAHQRASGDLCGTILRYNAGHFAKRMNPVSRRYCQKVKVIMANT